MKKLVSGICGNWMCVALVLFLAFSLTACGNSKAEPLQATEQQSVPSTAIETMYGTLQFPEEVFENLRHLEVTEGNVAMEVFYMVYEGTEKELYRIYFADAKIGTPMGYLTTDSGEIPVAYSTCEYEDKDFASEEELKLYYSMMDGFSVLMNSIYADERFSETRAVAAVAEREVKLRHWKVTLPENIWYEENEVDGLYSATFYSEVGGERINLYTFSIGDTEAESTLGFFAVGNQKKPVMIQTYDLERFSLWSEEEQMTIHRMMATINQVIDAIMQSEQFSTEAE